MSDVIAINRIRLDGGTQSRAELNRDRVEQLSELVRRGVPLTPIDLYFDGVDYWPSDGFHRIDGTALGGKANILANVKQGTREDAVWASLAANREHDTAGLCRSRADIRRAIERALAHPRGESMSDRKIASHVGCNHETVATARLRLVASGGIRQMETRTIERNGTTYEQNTSNIGRRPTAKPRDLEEDEPDIEREPDVYVPDPAPKPRIDPPALKGWGASEIARFAAETIIYMRDVQAKSRARFAAVDARFEREARESTQDVVLETIEALRALLPEEQSAPKFNLIRGGK